MNESLSPIKEALEKTSLHQLIGAINVFNKEDDQAKADVPVYVLRNHTVDNLKWFLEGQGFLEDLNISYSQSEYNTIMEEIFDSKSALYQTQPQVIILSLMFENLIPEYANNEFTVEEVVDSIKQMVDNLRANSSGLIVLNTFLTHLHNSEGFYSSKNINSIENKIKAVNAWIYELAQTQQGIYLVDWNQIEQRLGEEQSRDYRMWYVAKALLTNKFLKSYAFEILKIVKALKGKTKKCLVLDCDNTLWGGIVGEDGVDNLKLDPHEYPGNTFYHFQQNVLRLLERGIIIVLCSKNNEEDAWEVFDKHPYCLLKRKHIANWRINWQDKATNIKSLAEDLSLGIDSFVFVDDNPAEIELIKQMLPEVTTLQVPADLSQYPPMILKDGLFDALSVSKEDKDRTTMYQAETQRKKEEKRFNNYDDFLKSLELVITVKTATEKEIPRVAQLTQKTNQFNLTTKRYSQEDIKSFVDSEDHQVLYLHLTDRFGDHGIVGVAILKYKGKEAAFDTFLMSCRVLGKGAEDFFLKAALNAAKMKGKGLAVGEYLPTKKNSLVKDFYDKRGFTVESQEDGRAVYHCDLDSFEFKPQKFFKDVIIDESLETQGVN